MVGFFPFLSFILIRVLTDLVDFDDLEMDAEETPLANRSAWTSSLKSETDKGKSDAEATVDGQRQSGEMWKNALLEKKEAQSRELDRKAEVSWWG